MKATELIGRKAIRTGPIFYGTEGTFDERPDYSFCGEGVEILNATDKHIVLSSQCRNGEHVLDLRWCDDKWIPYDTIVTENVKTRLGVLRSMGRGK